MKAKRNKIESAVKVKPLQKGLIALITKFPCVVPFYSRVVPSIKRWRVTLGFRVSMRRIASLLKSLRMHSAAKAGKVAHTKSRSSKRR